MDNNMNLFNDSFLILVTTPMYVILIAAEVLVSHFQHRRYYTLRGTLSNIYLAFACVCLDVAMRAIWFAVLASVYAFHFMQVTNSWLYWPTLLILQDLAFYFLHRVDHSCRLFWAVHVTHHSAEEFNLSVGIRPSVLQPLYRFAWFCPLALFGFRPEDIMLMYSITQIYGVLIHTQYVDKLGFLEWFMATPSHHRVHHGCNPQYLDRNLGMVFIIWDRIFGTFAEEKEEVRYGLAGNVRASGPVGLIFHEWLAIVRDLSKPAPLRAKLMYVLGPPGWKFKSNQNSDCDNRPARLPSDLEFLGAYRRPKGK
jgi:sterol desaturase/sphingolipid hydroxylase (fatty acid hydroxylase superfamily)